MKYTIIYSDTAPAKRIFDGHVLGYFNNSKDMPIKYTTLKNIRHALKHNRGPSYRYLDDKSLYKIKSLIEMEEKT